MIMVMIFVVLFSAILGVAWRRIASALRVEHVCEVRRQCDKGSLQAMAAAMAVLETGLRWNNTGTIATLNGSDAASISYKKNIPDDQENAHWHTVTFQRSKDDGTGWRVDVVVEQGEPSGLDELPSNPP